MQPWEVNDIDQTFQHAAEKAQFNYEPQDWNALSGKLAGLERKAMLTRGLITSGLAGIIALGSYFGLKEAPTSNTEESVVITNDLSTQAEAGYVRKEAITLSEATETADPSKSNPNQSSSQGAFEQVLVPQDETPKDSPSIPTLTLTDISPTGPEVPYQSAKPRTKQLVMRGKTSLIAPGITAPRGISTINQMGAIPLSEVIGTPKAKNKGRMSFGLSYVPDNTGISFEGTQVSHGVSVNFAYQFAGRFSVIGGITKQHKTFEINKGLENYPELWNRVQMPPHILAESLVLEIPLTVRMDLVKSPKNKLFVGTGLSSYFMLEEDYIFDYHYAEGSDVIPGIEVKGGNKHIFSIYNLSVGFQRQITRNFALEIEPYLKLPLTGVGIWDVNLTSSGTYITARYFLR